MAMRPESGSLAVTLTVALPVSVAPAAGEVTVTTGGVPSGGAALKATACITQPPFWSPAVAVYEPAAPATRSSAASPSGWVMNRSV